MNSFKNHDKFRNLVYKNFSVNYPSIISIIFKRFNYLNLLVCGMKTPNGISNIINGTNAVRGDYPWHVGIYNTAKELICGGAIIDESIVLSGRNYYIIHTKNLHTEKY